MFKPEAPLPFVKQPEHYFYGVYLPILLAVFFKMLIGYPYAAAKMIELFAMLGRPGGVPAKDFLRINYLSANDTSAPFQAMLSGRWLMLWTSILYAALQLLSPLTSKLCSIYPSYFEVAEHTFIVATGTNANPPKIHV